MTATDNSFAVSRLEAFPARPLASGEREVFEERFIAAVLKDSTGERWQECRQLPREAFGDYQRGKLWKEITGAESYDEAALTSGARKYFGHTTCGESYVDDKTAMYCGWIQLKGLGFAPKWLAALPISPAASAASEMKWGDLLAFDRSNDLDCLMGNRYLGRTGGLVLVGPSGVGKSVAALQLAACAALGRPFLGLQMHYRMRILYIQAEDDLGDVGEAVQGFVQGYTLTTEALVELKTNLRIVRWNDCAGQKFLGRLRAELAKHPADLVIINPLFSFCGCAVSEQKEMSAFLRNGLNPILNETRAACGIVHHTNKPNTDPKKAASDAAEDQSYLGSGSAELTNWARCYITLQSVKASGGKAYKLIFAKRGKRAGIVDNEGKPTTSVIVEHSSHGLCWLASDWKPETGEGGKFKPKFDLPRAAKMYDSSLSWRQNEALIAADQGMTTRAVRDYRHNLEAVA